MRLNERIVRILDWPVKQTERMGDWLEEGMRTVEMVGNPQNDITMEVKS